MNGLVERIRVGRNLNKIRIKIMIYTEDHNSIWEVLLLWKTFYILIVRCVQADYNMLSVNIQIRKTRYTFVK